MIRVVVITGTRSEYGILKPVLARISTSKNLELLLVVTGMHLAPEYGETVREIESDGWEIAAKVEMQLSSDRSPAMAKSLGIGVYGLTQELERLLPDITLILGDRIEAFAGATAGLFTRSVVAHIHGGEVTRGGWDEYMRHAITKLSHIHFAATQQSRERIIRMGENPNYVYFSGTPGLDAIQNYSDFPLERLSEKIGFELPECFGLWVQHPVSSHPETALAEMRETYQALEESNIDCLQIYPNADAGSRSMIEEIKTWQRQRGWKALVTVSREVYCNLLKRCAVLVGNSSSGIIDAPAFGVPVVNIGERQQYRERAENVLDAEPRRESIKKALQRALYDEGFLKQCRACQNPYGDGKAAERIVNVLERIDLKNAIEEKGIMHST